MEYLKGGHIAFDVESMPVAAYIYTRDGTDIYFGLVRKLFSDGRRIIPRKNPHVGYILDGAAGTDRKYWGKWTSIGGNRDKKIHNLAAIIEELNHETGAEYYIGKKFISNEVDLSKVGIPIKSYKKELKCKHIEKKEGVIICILKMENTIFFNLFPKAGRTSPEILYSSQGEIDATKSFTIKELFDSQSLAITKKNNNFLISYFVKNLYEVVLPKIVPSLEYIDNFKDLYVIDTNSRTPWELTHEPYYRDNTGKYHEQYLCVIS
jgi:hypothetical protein